MSSESNLNPGKTFSNISDLSAKYMSKDGLVKNHKVQGCKLGGNWVSVIFYRLGLKEEAMKISHHG